MRLQFQLAVVTHRGSGFRILALPKAEFDRLVCSGIIGSPLLTQLGSPHSQQLGRLELRQTGEWKRLEEGASFSGLLYPNRGRQGKGVCGESKKLIARDNWRNVGMIGYQIGRKKGGKK